MIHVFSFTGWHVTLVEADRLNLSQFRDRAGVPVPIPAEVDPEECVVFTMVRWHASTSIDHHLSSLASANAVTLLDPKLFSDQILLIVLKLSIWGFRPTGRPTQPRRTSASNRSYGNFRHCYGAFIAHCHALHCLPPPTAPCYSWCPGLSEGDGSFDIVGG